MNVNLNNINNLFFVGIAGTGMSAIAQYLNGIGKHVSGSDRYFGTNQKMPVEVQFEKLGIDCYFQDGSGITSETELLVISTAIEPSNIEYKKALKLNIPIIKRSEILARIANDMKTIAVGGTSGKSTTTAMIFHIMSETGHDPSLITGAGLSTLQDQGLPGNAWVGKSDWLIIEADESDGSIVAYKPEISVLLNMERDHKEYDELMSLFKTFKNNTRSSFIVNQNDIRTKQLSLDPSDDFGINIPTGISGSEFIQKGFNIEFKVDDDFASIPAIGRHNMENALAAFAVCKASGIPLKESIKTLKNFKGIYRRTQLIGEKKGVTVVDDFAHNPAEVAATIKACQSISKRVFAWFQPHGFGPLRFMQNDLIHSVDITLRSSDFFIMPDVYYAGGTVTKDVTSEMIIQKLNKDNNVLYIPKKKSFIPYIQENALPGDLILIMGARDPGLAEFSKNILKSL